MASVDRGQSEGDPIMKRRLFNLTDNFGLLLMPAMVLLILSCTSGCEKPQAPAPNLAPAPAPGQAPPSATGPAQMTQQTQAWIRVHQGSPQLVKQAIEDYADLLGKKHPKEFRVTIAKHPSGYLVVNFPDGIPPYALVNLIGWLNQPPEIKGVTGAAG